MQKLSSQLRTRLSYAMVKLQNGWQSHNLNELELMASAQASPTSAMSDRPEGNCTTPAAPVSTDGNRQMPSFARASGFLQEPGFIGRYTSQSDAKVRSTSPQIGVSYESFWREHEATSIAKRPIPQSPPVRGPTLAPPVDIVARVSHRSGSSSRQPPPLQTINLSNLSSHLFSAAPTLPATPPSKKKPKLRTPSQQAAVEKDVVESLLFMSSPGNSAHPSHSTATGTPSLCAAFAPRGNQRIEISASKQDKVTNQSVQSYGPRKLALKVSPLTTLHTTRNIDRMLDEMPDISSSDEEHIHNSHR